VPRILRIINRLNIGGPTLNAVLLSKHLSPDFETLLVAGSKDKTEESSDYLVKRQGLEYVEIPEMKRAINPFEDRKAYKRISALINAFKPDIVHTHAAKAGAIGRLAAHHAKVPVIVHTFHGHVFHSYFNPITTKAFLHIERYLARKSDAIIAISEKQKQELTADYSVCTPEKVHIIPLGFDLSKFRENQDNKRDLFRKEYGLQPNDLAIGIVGRLVPVKNHRLFLSAAAELIKRTNQSIRFFIVGDGELCAELIEYATQLELDTTYFPDNPRTATVTFTSWRKDVDVVMAGLDVVGLTSWNEGTPVSLIEAQAAGKPIVSTQVGGIENTVEPNKSGLLVPTGDLSLFVNALERLVVDADLRQQLSSNGWTYVNQKFHFTRLVKDTKKLYLNLLNNSKRII
jgi:glycosyltransferase involved in cell wall biosynthesis